MMMIQIRYPELAFSLIGATLAQFFEQRYIHEFLGADTSPRTIQAYQEALRHWEAISGRPPLWQIDSAMLAAYRDGLRGREARCLRPPCSRQLSFFAEPDLPRSPHRALSRATANKHLRAIMAILAKAGPPGPRNHDALGLIARAPWAKPCREYRRLARPAPLRSIERIYLAAGSATLPALPGVNPGRWWQAYVVTAVQVGFRRGAMLGLRWEDVDWEQRSIRLPAELDKCRCERCKPLAEVTVRHLLRIRGDWELVFSWPHALVSLSRQWRRLNRAAGLAKAEWLTIHDLKRACGTLYSQSASPFVVQQMLDHASIETSRHYVNPVDDLRPAAEAIRLAPAFYAEVDMDGPPVGTGGPSRIAT